ncbi:PLP-dependent transferase [Violaceomyces palustris]|uniref:PLP-dependent transferase n=1 Tax=Violaceomyces palustris TaxID=1673888 RepID=A0ACD0NRD1_9BASI|nr:PLP-dependent transferase [Violaceomyces palustris]
MRSISLLQPLRFPTHHRAQLKNLDRAQVSLRRTFQTTTINTTATATATASSSSKDDSKMTSRFHKERSSRIKTELSRGLDVWSLFNPVVFPSAVNLGQGFMNWQPPKYVLKGMNEAIEERVDVHHYSHPKGRLRLRQAISDHYSSEFNPPDSLLPGADRWDGQGDSGPGLRMPSAKGRRLDVEEEIQVTSGANGGMYSILGAFLEEGDEVICIEPYFDQYEAEIIFNGGVPTYVPLIPPASSKADGSRANLVSSASEWRMDWQLLEEKMSSPKCKAMFLNTPHNPVGKIFTLEELSRLAKLCTKYDILVISDEVYDCLTYDGEKHIRIASLEGMWDRTITVGSAGKSFACTGWRVGWLIGPPHLIGPARTVHTRITFAVNSAAQEGSAIGLERSSEEGFFARQIHEYDQRRLELTSILDKLGLPYTMPQGSYFVMADVSDVVIPEDFEIPPRISSKALDYSKAWFIAKTCDVVVIPSTAFYSDQNANVGERFVRFSFCKDGQLQEAGERLKKLLPFIKRD